MNYLLFYEIWTVGIHEVLPQVPFDVAAGYQSPFEKLAQVLREMHSNKVVT